MQLQELLGEELFAQVDEKIQTHNKGIDDKLKHVRYADLSEGKYVSTEKHQALETKSGGLEAQLKEANETLAKFKDIKIEDVEALKKTATDWETKYNTDTEALNKKIADTEKSHAAERFIGEQNIKSPLSKKAILQEFLAEGMKFKDGKFQGADDFIKGMKEKYPEEFISKETKEDNPPPNPANWVRGTTGTHKPNSETEESTYLDKKYGKTKYY
jgi:hypothetical protein